MIKLYYFMIEHITYYINIIKKLNTIILCQNKKYKKYIKYIKYILSFYMKSFYKMNLVELYLCMIMLIIKIL